MARLRVFLSHLNAEARFADALKERLARDFIGLVDLFVASDATSIPVGTHWLAQVIEAIRSAQLQMILCSSEAVVRPWINYEAGAARLQGVPMIPLCHSGIAPAQLPVPLSESEGVILTEAKGIERLYRRIAELLGSTLPAVDFEAYARTFQELEAAYASERGRGAKALADSGTESIMDPRVLCISSPQFLELGFRNQMQLVLDVFPSDLEHKQVLSSLQVQGVLTSQRVDIVHIAAYVCPRRGELYFSDVDLETGEGREGPLDVLSADALASLVAMARTRLVVISSCESLALATTLLSVTNVIAARDLVSAKAMASWVEHFYRNLRSQPLAVACRMAGNVSHAPMRLFAQQRRAPEMTVGTTGGDLRPSPVINAS